MTHTIVATTGSAMTERRSAESTAGCEAYVGRTSAFFAFTPRKVSSHA